MSIGTFGSFTQARLAIYAAQSGLSITGNNISNVNTKGYTRQRLDQGSLHIGGTDRYANPSDVRTGQGVLCTGVSQLRDPYLDIRFRSVNASVGANDVMLGGLEQIASILDEVGKGEQTEGEDFGILHAQIMDLFKALGDVTDQTGHAEYNRQVRAAAEKLSRYFNQYATKLQQVHDNAVTAYEQDIKTVNGILSSIREYNEEIRNCDIHGDKALELRDQRNVLLDELSQYMKINVVYSMEEIAPGVEVEKCTVKLDNANPDPSVLTDEAILVDGIYVGQLEIDQVPAMRELDPLDKTTWPYLDANGNPTMFKDDAAEALVPNPNFNAGAADSDTNPRYLMADGTATNDPAQAAKAKTLNDKADFTQANSTANPWYLDEAGNPTDDPAKSAATYQENPDYVPYLDGKNNPTKNLEDAKLVNNPNYSLTLSELRDRQGYLHYITERQIPEVFKKGDTINGVTYDDIKELAGKKQPITEIDPHTGNKILTNYYISGRDANGDPIYTKQAFVQILSTPVSFDDNDLYGALQSDRELLTEEGEFTDLSIIKGTNENPLYCDEKAASKRGIPYYQRSLDLLANQIAKVLNDANKGYYVDNNDNYVGQILNADGTPKLHEVTGKPMGGPVTVEYEKTDNSTTPPTTTTESYALKHGDTKESLDKVDPNIWKTMQEQFDAAQAAGLIDADAKLETVEDYLEVPQMKQVTDPNDPTKTTWEAVKTPDDKTVSNGIFTGGNLFSNHGAGDDDTNITASNISVSHSWSEGAIDMVQSFECPPGETKPVSGANGGFLHFQNLVDKKFDFIPSDLFETRDGSGDVMFNGTFAEMFENIQSVLGNDIKVTKSGLNAAYQSATEVDTNRDSVSAVDFNDEAMNLMMYAKSYNAACRLMTTIDSVLEKLVNGTGVTT